MNESVRRLQAIRLVGPERYELAFGVDDAASDLVTVLDGHGRTIDGDALFGTRHDLRWSGDAESMRSLFRLVDAFAEARAEGFTIDG